MVHGRDAKGRRCRTKKQQQGYRRLAGVLEKSGEVDMCLDVGAVVSDGDGSGW